MKIWIDFSNSPHPLLFAPVARRLEAEGHEVLVTARDNAQTIELARERWPAVEVIGGPSPRGRASKVATLGEPHPSTSAVGRRLSVPTSRSRTTPMRRSSPRAACESRPSRRWTSSTSPPTTWHSASPRRCWCRSAAAGCDPAAGCPSSEGRALRGAQGGALHRRFQTRSRDPGQGRGRSTAPASWPWRELRRPARSTTLPRTRCSNRRSRPCAGRKTSSAWCSRATRSRSPRSNVSVCATASSPARRSIPDRWCTPPT